MFRLNWQHIKRINHFAPTIGAVIFLALYVYAATLYPGGSHNHPKAIGFSFFDNYLCNLLSRYSINGHLNDARPYAITALGFLGLGLGNFFYFIPISFASSEKIKWSIQISGNISTVFILLLFTKNHDLLVSFASVFALIALILVFIILYENQEFKLLLIGLLCAILLALNGYMYSSEIGIAYLPLLQKFTFAIILWWIVIMNIEIDRKLND